MSDPPADLPEATGPRLHAREQGLSTSDLSVNEFLLVKQARFHPVGFVMGSPICHIGFQTRKWGESQGLTRLTETMYDAPELAMTRMAEEATELGADGVVGVRLEQSPLTNASRSAASTPITRAMSCARSPRNTVICKKYSWVV